MTDQEAIVVLKNCKALAEKVRSHGVDFALNQNDSDNLSAYKRIYQSGRVYLLLNSAGLNQQEYLLLGKLAARKAI